MISDADKQWIIPALAGNTDVMLTWAAKQPDHPRSRGEYSVVREDQMRALGSSPLSRGIPGGAVCAGCGGGIIPALAGNTDGTASLVELHRDHPRSRGEY